MFKKGKIDRYRTYKERVFQRSGGGGYRRNKHQKANSRSHFGWINI
jgi:hypothetical protein